MKSLLISLLFEINDSKNIALFVIFLLILIIAVILYKNIAIKKIDGVLTSVEEEAVMDYLPVFCPNGLSPIIKTKMNKFILKINCHGKIIKITEDPDLYLKELKEKIKMKVKILYVKIKFLHIKFIWSMQY
ncbi:MAG: hypothetical protein QG630_127 [Patescibacteria group bacterium]|nr:hypothetical protein [Patescibacteria group bacterium]